MAVAAALSRRIVISGMVSESSSLSLQSKWLDDTVTVARVTTDDGTLLASIVNYACHPTTLAWDNTLISPDYIGAMREVVERDTGAPCLFLQGACGELGRARGSSATLR